MSRAGLLSTCGDIFITSLLLKLWKRDWYSEIDHMYINLNNHCGVPTEAITEFFGEIAKDPKITFVYHPTGIGNGPPQVELLKLCNEDLILLLEDDFFIFKSGIVDGYFKKIESGEADLLGSPRYTYGEVADAAKKKYNLVYEGEGDRGFGWWPTGFYCKRADLMKTDLDFGSKKYGKGEYFKELDYTFKEDNYTDTFTWTSIQLRYMGLRAIEIPQYHAMPFIKDQSLNISYIHGGSLSAGWGGYLSGRIPDVSNENAKQEMESRVAFWRIAVGYGFPDIFGEDNNGIKSFAFDYAQGIEYLVQVCKLDPDRILAKIKIYRNLMRI